MLKLYTKNGCAPCQKVKEYLAGKTDLNVEVINCSENPERVTDFAAFSKQFPTLLTDWGFIVNSDDIIAHLSTYQSNSNQPRQENIQTNIDNKITRIAEPECEACQ